MVIYFLVALAVAGNLSLPEIIRTKNYSLAEAAGSALGIIFYLVMDIAIHWGVFRHLRHQVNANGAILLTAIALDVIVLAAFCYRKILDDPGVLGVAAGAHGNATGSVMLAEAFGYALIPCRLTLYYYSHMKNAYPTRVPIA